MGGASTSASPWDAEHALGETEMSATDKAASVCPTGCLVVKGKGWATPVGKRDYDTTPLVRMLSSRQRADGGYRLGEKGLLNHG